METLKEEAKRLREETIDLQRQREEKEQLHSDQQEQIGQLTKHVKTIPDLHRDLSALQNQLLSVDRRMKRASEQARGAQLPLAPAGDQRCADPDIKQGPLSPSIFPAVKIGDVARQLLHGAVEEEVLLGSAKRLRFKF